MGSVDKKKLKQPKVVIPVYALSFFFFFLGGRWHAMFGIGAGNFTVNGNGFAEGFLLFTEIFGGFR